MDIIEKLNWRYATKQFDSTKKLKPEQLELLLKAINLTASSFGLQPYSIIVIEDKAIRKQLKEAAWQQTQVTDASQVILFAAKTDLSSTDIDEYIQRISVARNIPIEALAEYEGMMKGSLSSQSQEDITTWAAKQAYIALGQLLVSCAIESIDACPMEGFDKTQFDKILKLKEKNLTSVVMATVGFRSSEDQYQHLPKVRKNIDDIIIRQ